MRETCLSTNSYRFLEAGEQAQWLPPSLTSLLLCGNTQRHHRVFDGGVSRAFVAWMGDIQCCYALAVSTTLLGNDPSPVVIRRKSTGRKLPPSGSSTLQFTRGHPERPTVGAEPLPSCLFQACSSAAESILRSHDKSLSGQSHYSMRIYTFKNNFY